MTVFDTPQNKMVTLILIHQTKSTPA